MCGIVGYIGENSVKHSIDGIHLLQYRGYDSAGISFIIGRKLNTVKTTKTVDNLRTIINQHINDSVRVAIAHTRWATHGKPTETNAHPHTAGNIAVVHNGIIENYHHLKRLDWLKDIDLVSETDSEVVAHIINLMEGPTLLSKVEQALEHLQGSYALAVMSEDEPDTIVVARKLSPLVVGIFDDGAVVASDIQAILPHTNRVVVLADFDIGVVRKNELTLYQHGQKVTREPLEIAWSVAQSSKGGADTFMEKEIHEQPVAIYDTMMNNNWDKIAEKIFLLYSTKAITNVTLMACGTSLHACMIGSMMIEGLVHIRARPRLASEIISSGAIINSNDLVIAVSQSGETADTARAIQHARRRGATVVSIVNTMGSTIEGLSNYTIHTAAGPEISVASTKAFSSQLVVLAMITVMLRACSIGSSIVQGQFVDTQNEIYRCADELARIFDQKEKIIKIAESIADANTILYLGRGLNVPTALEGALKLKEISYIHAEGFAAGEMKHGSIALIEEGTPVVAIITKDQVYEKMLSSIEEAKSRGARIIAIATEGDTEVEKIAEKVIYIPEVGEIFTPLMATVPLQLLAMYTAEVLGRDIDKPRNLAKSCTVE